GDDRPMGGGEPARLRAYGCLRARHDAISAAGEQGPRGALGQGTLPAAHHRRGPPAQSGRYIRGRWHLLRPGEKVTGGGALTPWARGTATLHISPRAPRRPPPRETEGGRATEQFIDNEVKGNDVVLFMKGTPQFPMCGFSGQVVQILDHLGVSYKGLNVLESDDLREGIKSYSNWPTIPQLYVKGEFVGGCD